MKKTILALAVIALLCVTLVLFLGGWDFPGSSGSGEAASPGKSVLDHSTGSDSADPPAGEDPANPPTGEDLADPPTSEDLAEPETESGQSQAKKQFLFPESLPEGYELQWGNSYKDGESDFMWRNDGDYMPTVLNLTINGDNDQFKADWEIQTKPYEQTEREVNGMSVHCWQSDWASQLLWRFNGTPYSIVSKGPQRLTVEELLELVEGMTLSD